MANGRALKNSKKADLAKKNFYNKLNCGISDKNYEHVLYVWEVSEMNTVKYYNDLYMKINVLLLV